eukprot:5530261-Pyramimonas_sp.AAC.1
MRAHAHAHTQTHAHAPNEAVSDALPGWTRKGQRKLTVEGVLHFNSSCRRESPREGRSEQAALCPAPREHPREPSEALMSKRLLGWPPPAPP